MRIKEIAQRSGMSQRAIKYYEEKGLLIVPRDASGYRCYDEGHLFRLHQISVWRKLGMDIETIAVISAHEVSEKDALEKLYAQKKTLSQCTQEQLCAIRALLDDGDHAQADERLDHQLIIDAISEMIPGTLGKMLCHHFRPYLQIPFSTCEQREAFAQIIAFWDQADIRMPFSLRCYMALVSRIDEHVLLQSGDAASAKLREAVAPDEAQYAQLLRQSRKARWLRLVSPAYWLRRRFARALHQIGYDTVFLPAMERLSPPYRAYRHALLKLDHRVRMDMKARM